MSDSTEGAKPSAGPVAAATPEPAPAAAEPATRTIDLTHLGGQAPMGMVRGGTTSMRYDREVKQREVEAEARRAYQDKQYGAGREAAQRGDTVTRLGSMRLINESSPRLVLSYLRRDKTVRQQCKSEITMMPIEGKQNEWEIMFAMVCPHCVARGVPQGQAQMLIRSENRKFSLDERLKGTIVVLDHDYGDGMPFKEPVIIAGTVTAHETIRCDNHNCTFACRIDNSNIIEV
jgi:hypothetical protein